MTCSNGIERRLCVSAVSRFSEVTRNQIRNKPEKNEIKILKIREIMLFTVGADGEANIPLL